MTIIILAGMFTLLGGLIWQNAVVTFIGFAVFVSALILEKGQ